MIRLIFALVLGFCAIAPASATTIMNIPAPVALDPLEPGLRFFGKKEDFRIYAVSSSAEDQEVMYVAVRKTQPDRAAGFFRAGMAQCFEGKYGGDPMPCEQPSPAPGPAEYKLKPGVYTTPSRILPPTSDGGIVPPWVFIPEDPTDPVDPIDPIDPSPVPVPGSLLNLLLALLTTGGIGWFLVRFSGRYEEESRMSCGDPEAVCK